MAHQHNVFRLEPVTDGVKRRGGVDDRVETRTVPPAQAVLDPSHLHAATQPVKERKPKAEGEKAPAKPEIAAANFLWPRLEPGAFMLLDDYGWAPHIHQKRAWDVWAKENQIRILSLPTGQGLIMKPR